MFTQLEFSVEGIIWHAHSVYSPDSLRNTRGLQNEIRRLSNTRFQNASFLWSSAVGSVDCTFG